MDEVLAEPSIGHEVEEEEAVTRLMVDVTNVSILQTWPDWRPLLQHHHQLCSSWAPLHHLYYQVANLLLLLAILIPLKGGSVTVLGLRLGLVLYSGLTLLWALLVSNSCKLDTIGWAIVILTVNMIYTIQGVYRVYSLHCTHVPADLRPAYDILFKPLGVSRAQYKKLLSCTKEVVEVSPKEKVITEKISRVDCLSLLLRGRLIVSQGGRALHLVSDNQFLDSPEWFGVSTDEYFQVTVTALETSKIVMWHRDRVKFCLMEDQELQAIFDHVVGRDVVRKLMQVNTLAEELQLNLEKTGDTTEVVGGDAGGDVGGTGDDWDDKRPMIAKEGLKEKSLLGSLMGGDIPAWRLVNIKETDDETIV